jgi:hypothetical protein
MPPIFQEETFEFLPKPGKSSFLRKQESSPFKTFWIPAYAGMTKWGYFSKVSGRHGRNVLLRPPFFKNSSGEKR